MSTLKETLNKIQNSHIDDFNKHNSLFIEALNLFEKQNTEIKKEDIENFSTIYIEALENYNTNEQELMLDEFAECLLEERENLLNNDFLIHTLDQLSKHQYENNLSSIEFITRLQYLHDYHEETSEKIHEIFKNNVYEDYFAYVDFSFAFYELNDPVDIITLIKSNNTYNSFEDIIQEVSNCILEEGRDIEILGDVLNRLVSDISNKNCTYEALTNSFFDQLTRDGKYPILSYIKDPQKVIIHNDHVNTELLNIFVNNDAISQSNITEIIAEIYEFNDVINFFENTNITKLSFEAIDAGLKQLDNTYYLNEYNIEVISGLLAHIGKEPEDYFDLDYLNDEEVRLFDSIFEKEKISVQIGNF